MKYVVVLADGMAGLPLAELDNQTTLAYAKTPYMDMLSGMGEIGLASMVPSSMKPGSDVANLSVLGYDPLKCYSGRSPLEALSVGVQMEPEDVIFRSNLVTLTESEPYTEKTILDHSSGEISTEDADVLMDAVREAFHCSRIQFYTGTSYRHIMVWKDGRVPELEPPHDHLGHVIGPWLPKEPLLLEMMEESYQILNDHPINQKRAAEGKHKANSLWFWGAGTKPGIQNFLEKTGLRGAMISAVDLLKGIGVGAGMKVIRVPGATGSLDTNYAGKAQAALKALLEDDLDFAFIHVEAPDEMGHQGNAAHKVQSIEHIDAEILGPIYEELLKKQVPCRIMVLPDHPTPVCVRTHTMAPVPYLIYDSRHQKKAIGRFTEQEAADSGNYEPLGYRLLDRLIEKEE